MDKTNNPQKVENNVNNNNQQNTYNQSGRKMNTRTTLNYLVKKQIYDWLKTEPYRDLLAYVQSRVMGQEEVSAVVANVYNYLRRAVDMRGRFNLQTRSSANNMLLCAPSGCGKTETYRSLKDYFASCIPLLSISIIDISNITPTGFRGPDPASIVEPFLEYGPEPIGIVFLDEFDKICIPSYTAEHSDVHLDVQHNILTIIEGSMVEVKQRHINTKNLLFIGAGSFDSFRKVREIEGKAGIGFGKSENKEKEHFVPVTRENMITAGGCHELIGRFAYIVNYHSLDHDVILRVIEKDRRTIESDFGCNLVLKPKVLDALCEQSNSKFGCRLLDSLMREPVLKAYSDAMQSEYCGDVIVITLNSLDSYSFDFKDYEQEEDYPELYNSGDTLNINEQTKRMNLEEVLSMLLGNN